MFLLAYAQPTAAPFPQRRLWLAATCGTLLLSANTLILAVMLPSAAFRDRLPPVFALPACFLLLPIIAIGIPLAGTALLRNALFQKRMPLLACLIMSLLSLLTSAFMAAEFLHISGGLGMEFLLFGAAPILVAGISLLLSLLLLSLLNSPLNPGAPFEPREFLFQRFLESICSRTTPIALVAFILAYVGSPFHEFNRPFHLFNIPSLRPALYALNILASGGLLIPALLMVIAATPFRRLLLPAPSSLKSLQSPRELRSRILSLAITISLLVSACILLLPPSPSAFESPGSFYTLVLKDTHE